MKNDMVLADGKIVDPVTGYFGPATVFIADGKIEKVEKRKKSKITGDARPRPPEDLHPSPACPIPIRPSMTPALLNT